MPERRPPEQMASRKKKTAAKKSSKSSKARRGKAKKASKAAGRGKSRAAGKAKKKPPKKKSAKQTTKKKKAVRKTAAKKKPPARSTTRQKAGRKKPAKKPATKAKAAAKKQALERAKAQKARERERLRKAKEKERLQAAKEKERLNAQKLRDQAKALKEKERAKALKEKERLQRQKAKEKERAAKEKQKEQLRKAKEAEKARKQKEVEKARQKAQREAERAAAKRAREEEKARLKAEREAEKERLKAEREAEKERLKAEREAEKERKREEARRKKEEERREREAAREAYRKAKQAELARIRAEREAAKRALEGKIAKASGRGHRAGSMRSATTTRVYTPASIPNQSGTRRGAMEDPYAKFANLRAPQVTPGMQIPNEPRPATIPPPPPPEPPKDLGQRFELLQRRLHEADPDFTRAYQENFIMSWIFHDSALEGVVYTYEELRTAVNPNVAVVPDSSLQSVCEEIRRHKIAVELVQELGEKKRQPVSLELMKRIYLTLHPDEGDLKTVKYRKDIPQHRLYFHEYAQPDKVAYKVRQVFDWLNGPEPKKLKNPLRVAAKIHYDLLRIFPFPKDSGKVVRLLMNVLLLRNDYPPALIHSAERQRYYDALRGSPAVLYTMLEEAVINAMQSIEKKLDERDSKKRAFVTQ